MRTILASILLLALALPCYGANVIVVWEDESNTDHDGYRIYYGKESHAGIRMPGEPPAPYDKHVDVMDPEARSHKIDVPVGVWYFRVQTLGSDDGKPLNSPLSAEVGDSFLFAKPTEVRVK